MTRRKGFASEAERAGRVLSHGKLAADALTGKSFSLNNGATPFALFIIEKAAKSTDPVTVNCQTWQGDAASGCPFTPNCWDVPAVREIAAAGIDLTLYDVYWGAGADVSLDDE